MREPTFLAFVATFVLGPALCALLLRCPAKAIPIVGLGAASALSTFGALVVPPRGNAVLVLTLLWLGWVLAVSMVALAIRRRLPGAAPKRALTVTALLATTLPWFGLATAEMMTS